MTFSALGWHCFFGFIVGSLAAIFISEKLERKWLAMAIAFVWFAVLLTIGCYPKPVAIITFGFIATVTIAMIIPILYIYTGENLPTRIPATGLSIPDRI